MAEHIYGFIATPPEEAATYAVAEFSAANLPPSVDLTPKMPPVVDQGQLGSCTANSLAGTFGYDLAVQGFPVFPASRLFIYWNERELDGTTSTDSGATITTSVKVGQKYGFPPETDWPYDINVFTHKPPHKAYTDGVKFEATTVQRVAQELDQLKAALAASRPINIGFTVYASFESAEVAQTGVVPMPASGESVLGGHAVVVVGYDDASQRFRLRNSWGTGWGQAGYFTMPYQYLTDASLASDFWLVQHVGPHGAAGFLDEAS